MLDLPKEDWHLERRSGSTTRQRQGPGRMRYIRSYCALRRIGFVVEGVDIDSTLRPFSLGASLLDHHLPKTLLRDGIAGEAQGQTYDGYWLHGVQRV